MDEPLSNLDAKLRVQMRSELVRMHQKLGTTFVYITHDQVEAMTMGDYIAVLRDGKIMQYDTPQEVYSNPANLFTARFIGDPGMNCLHLPEGGYVGFRSRKARWAGATAPWACGSGQSSPPRSVWAASSTTPSCWTAPPRS